MGGLPRKNGVMSSEEAEEGTTGQTTMTGVHSQGSDSKGNKSWGVRNTVRLFGRESPNLEAAQRAELEALGRKGGSARPWRQEADCKAGMAPGDPGGAILIVLWASRLQGVKTNPDGRDSLGMEKKVGRRQNTGYCGSPAAAPTQGSG